MDQELRIELTEEPDQTHKLTLVVPTGRFTMNPAQLSEAISALAIDRAAMDPPVSVDAPSMATLPHVADDPAMRWAYDEMSDRVALLIRHPGHGWIGYSLTMEIANALQLSLAQIADYRNKQRQTPH
ncbi:hypothetical protein ACKZDW_02340 (plasmid) [Ralstonia syzygii subsp. celebesensis]|uniref:hypothetical protein n=1 Tax=Ralstonia syzygii TaxID=28097 RepID=UPI00387E0520